jgi:hypothetical protein
MSVVVVVVLWVTSVLPAGGAPSVLAEPGNELQGTDPGELEHRARGPPPRPVCDPADGRNSILSVRSTNRSQRITRSP